MKKQRVLHKGQVLRGYLRAGTQILVQGGRLHIQYTPHYMGEYLLQQTRVLPEGEFEFIEEAGWVCLTGDGAEFLIMDAPPAGLSLACRDLMHGFWKKLAGVFERKRLYPPLR
ncbi:MAG: hypothetical protein ACRCU9_05830 [Iodobacter sp.]